MKRGLREAIGGRVGYGAFIAVFIVLFAVMVYSTGRSIDRGAGSEIILHERQVRDAYAALSDLQRVTNVLLLIERQGALTPERRDDLVRANDILWVRADDLRLYDPDAPENGKLADLVRDLNEVVERIDRLLATDGTGMGGHVVGIVAASDAARGTAMAFIDAMRRAHDGLVDGQAAALWKQNRLLVLLGFLLATTGIGVLTLLRREIVLRQQREAAEGRALFLAYHDALTRLPNRLSFNRKAGCALADRAEGSVWMIDVDRFKAINEALGPDAGDTVLCELGRRLEPLFNEQGGLVARISGDEFAGWLPQAGSKPIDLMAEWILSAAARPVQVGDRPVTTGVSVGVVSTRVAPRRDAGTLSALMGFAEVALDAARTEGRGRHRHYDTALHRLHTTRRRMTDALRRDIRDGAITVHLQPKHDLETGRTFGFEALARWTFEGEPVRPDHFIGLAEAAGFIADIDTAVLRKAVTAVSDWNLRHGTDFSVAVNLSGLHFDGDTLLATLQRTLAGSGLPPRLLTLEITESVQLNDWGRVSSVIEAIRAMGCKIAIDDFGTGYSSLAYLERMQADELKIDRSLVESVESSTRSRFLLSALLEYAEAHLGMTVLLEGIETDSQAQAVRALGGRFVQGFLFGRPVPTEEALRTATVRPSVRQA